MQDIKSELVAVKLEDSDDELPPKDLVLKNNQQITSATLIAKDPKNATKGRFCLHVTGTDDNGLKFATEAPKNAIDVYKLAGNALTNICVLPEHNEPIIGLKFTNPYTLYSGTLEGTVNVWDLRAPQKCTAQFRDTTTDNEKGRVFTCFDCSPNERIVSAGTEMYEGDSFILFWDVRNTKLLGGYWDSHYDSITQLKFHENDSNKLMSGSVDGLINVFDISQTTEDDALVETLNTESSIAKLKWFQNENRDGVTCITNTVDLQLWNLEDAKPFATFNRKQIFENTSGNADNCYLCSTEVDSKGLFVLAGSNVECNCLIGLRVDGDELKGDFKLPNCGQIIRDSWFSRKSDILVTVGEKGVLSVWDLKTEEIEEPTPKRRKK